MKLYKLLNPKFVYNNRRRVLPTIYLNIRKIIDEFKYISAVNNFPLTENDRKLLALKDKHKGHRCFIIGNGPSLKINDLDKLKGEITFAFNKIYLAFEQTEWRPTYYVVEDTLVAKQNYDVINNLRGFTKLFPTYLPERTNLPRFNDSIFYRIVGFGCVSKSKLSKTFNTDALDRLYAGGTVVYGAIQLACFMGIREIYLIGVDFSFNIPKQTDVENKRILISNGEINHFSSEYRKPGEKWYIPDLSRQERSFREARKAMKQLGGRIYNATRGGKLEVFPRIDFDTLFNGD